MHTENLKNGTAFLHKIVYNSRQSEMLAHRNWNML